MIYHVFAVVEFTYELSFLINHGCKEENGNIRGFTYIYNKIYKMYQKHRNHATQLSSVLYAKEIRSKKKT